MTRGEMPARLEWKRWRTTLVLAAFLCGGLVLEGRILHLQVYQKAFLSAQGDDRYLADRADFGAPGHDHRPARRTAGGEYPGGQHLGQSLGVGAGS